MFILLSNARNVLNLGTLLLWLLFSYFITSIVKIGVGVKAKSSGATAVLFDGLRINDEDAFRTDYGLISRSVLSTPIVKTLGKQMVIEYRIGLSF